MLCMSLFLLNLIVVEGRLNLRICLRVFAVFRNFYATEVARSNARLLMQAAYITLSDPWLRNFYCSGINSNL